MVIYKTQAIKLAGSKAQLARILGISHQAVSAWPNRKPIPKKRAAQLVLLYGEDSFK